MTKFMQAKFGTPANSRAYVDNFDRIFRGETKGQQMLKSDGDLSLRCSDCGKEHQQDVSGKWWPSCECEVMR